MQASEMVDIQGLGGAQADIGAGLNKALTVGQPNLPGATGSALVPQALDPLLVNTSFEMDNLVLWKDLTKLTVPSTVAQYAELSSYGGPPLDNSFMAEVDTPQSNDATYIARYDVLKQIGVKGSVSFTAMQVGSIVDPLTQETKTQTMALLRKIEGSLWYANSALSPKQWDGFITKILTRSPKQNIRDLRGLPLTQQEVVRASSIVAGAPNYGKLSKLYLNTLCKGDIATGITPFQRNMIGNGVDNSAVVLGLDPTHIRTTEGLLELKATPFLDDGGAPTMTSTGNPALVPATPTVTTATAAAAGPGQQSMFTAQSDVGDVSYVVQSCNRYGRSAPVYVTPNSTVAVAQGNVVTFSITPGAGNLPEWYSVFRTKTNSKSLTIIDHRLILRVPNTNGDGIPYNASSVIMDTNQKLPGTFDALAFDMAPDLNRFVQTGPMMRYMMGITQTAREFMLVLFGSPSMRAPGRVFLWQNIGLAPETPPIS